jgi:hypothetical protein
MPRGDWADMEMDASTGWDTIEDTVHPNVVPFHPDAHLVCENREIADARLQTMARADSLGWTQHGHPNMVVRAPMPDTIASSNGYAALSETDA